jgi:hypothetical protein
MSDVFKAIRIYDPAIDWSDDTGTPFERYAKERDDKLLVLKPGMKPVVFSCTSPTRSMVKWIEQSTTEVESFDRAFRACVRRIEYPDGASWAPAGVDTHGFVAMTEDEVHRFSRADVKEIGRIIWERRENPRDCVGGYTLQPSSQRPLAAAMLLCRSAEQSQRQQAATATRREDI